jgi:hypothetical protein
MLIAERLRFVILSVRPDRSLTAENLFLRRQLALSREGHQPWTHRCRALDELGPRLEAV